jgi:hypothetical protein
MDCRDLIDKRSKLHDEITAINEEIARVTHDDRHTTNSAFIGKCYKSTDQYKESHRVYYIYALREGDCDFISIEVSYWENEFMHYYSIESKTYFDPTRDQRDSGADKYEEITMDEFKKHYFEVQRRNNKLIPVLDI